MSEDSREALLHRLDSVRELQSIVRTMKALSAVSIRQYERAVQSLGHYSRTVDLGLFAVLRTMPADSTARAPVSTAGLLAFGSDHGLCGRFNDEVAEAAVHAAPAGPRGRLVAVGARLAALLAERGVAIEHELELPGTAARVTATVNRLLTIVEGWQAGSPGLTVHVVHHRRTGTGRGQVVVRDLLPVGLGRFRRLEPRWPSRGLPLVAGPLDAVLATLVRQHLFVTVFEACAESMAAEHASRLRAMQQAERALADHRDELLTAVRRERQRAITTELLDVVAGYESLRTAWHP